MWVSTFNTKPIVIVPIGTLILIYRLTRFCHITGCTIQMELSPMFDKCGNVLCRQCNKPMQLKKGQGSLIFKCDNCKVERELTSKETCIAA